MLHVIVNEKNEIDYYKQKWTVQKYIIFLSKEKKNIYYLSQNNDVIELQPNHKFEILCDW